MEKKKEEKKELKPVVKEIKGLKIGTLTISVRGDNVIMDKLPDSVKLEIQNKQEGKGKTAKKIRNIKQEIADAVHKTSKGKIGFPAYGFKKGMIEATSFVGGKDLSKKLVSSIRIVNAEEGLIPITFKRQTILQHSIGPQTKFSPVFEDWKCTLVIQYDQNNISDTDIITLLNYAGFYNGIGAWRPKGKDGGSGEYGTYKVIEKGDM